MTYEWEEPPNSIALLSESPELFCTTCLDRRRIGRHEVCKICSNPESVCACGTGITEGRLHCRVCLGRFKEEAAIRKRQDEEIERMERMLTRIGLPSVWPDLGPKPDGPKKPFLTAMQLVIVSVFWGLFGLGVLLLCLGGRL